jgi:hypothetical protein
MKPQDAAVYLNGVNDLKSGLRIFTVIQEAGVLQPLEMQTQSHASVKRWHGIVEWPSEGCSMNWASVNRWFVKSSMKIYGRGLSAWSSLHTDARRGRSNGHISCQGFVQNCQNNPNFINRIFLFPKVETALKRKRHQDVARIKENLTAQLHAGCFQKPFKWFNKCVQVDGNYTGQK